MNHSNDNANNDNNTNERDAGSNISKNNILCFPNMQ